jgi:multiple antibiotic resistance protein
MNMNLDTLLNALVAYFVIMDPLGVSLIFNGLTSDRDSSYRRSTAFRAVALSFFVVLGFGFFGASLLGRLGITMEAFRIAGGLLLFHTAFSMVVRPDQPSAGDKYKPVNDIAVFPLSFPLIAGPGCLTLTILLFSKSSETEGGLMATTLAIVILLGVMLVALLSSRRIAGIIGGTANAVIKRLLGVLLASLAVQFIADGVIGLIGQQVNGG